MARIFAAVMAVGVLLLPVACVNSRSNAGPVNTLQDVYKLALEGKIDETQEYFSDDLIKFLQTNPDWDMKKVWASRLENGRVRGVIVTEKSVDEKHARIKFMIANTEGMPGEEGEDSLVLEKGMWKFDKLERLR